MTETSTVPRRSRMRRFFGVALRFWTGESRLRAWVLTLLVLLFVGAQLAAAVGVNAWNRLFFDGLEKRDLAAVKQPKRARFRQQRYT